MKWLPLLLLASTLSFGQGAPIVDNAFRKFWAAKTTAEAEALAPEILKTRVSFDDAWKRLKAGRSYSNQETGAIITSYRLQNVAYYYAVNIPANYDPGERYQVRFQLHGGVGRSATNQPRNNGEIGALAGKPEQIYVVPYSWVDAPWWGDDQTENVKTIVDRLKRKYNVDENRVVVSGVSDGGSGSFYIAMRETTPFASFLPLNGFVMVLAHPSIDLGQLFPNNLLNKPLFIINGGQDQLYPTSRVEPYVKYLAASGVDIEYHPQPDAGHNTRWWPEMKDVFEKFVTEHPREPHPQRLSWETGDLEHGRAHWVVIEKLGIQEGDADDLPDMNVIERGTNTLFMRAWQVNPGRIDISRNGNVIEARTRGVAQFTLLLSPDVFDFDKPLKVVKNGRVAFEGRIGRRVETLLKWAARDNDRTMLYGAEITIR